VSEELTAREVKMPEDDQIGQVGARQEQRPGIGQKDATIDQRPLATGGSRTGQPGTWLPGPALNSGGRRRAGRDLQGWPAEIIRTCPMEESCRLRCRNCGDVVDPRRVELGYDYCLKEECQQRCVRRVELAAVGVNKAADYYERAEEVLPARPPATASTVAGGEDADGADRATPAPAPRSRATRRAQPRPQTTLERLRQQEAALDAALGRSFDRFSRGEITAQELDSERDGLIESFNRRVMSENIRYRSMLRRRPGRAR
jgi:hypothetical protein